MIGHLATEAGGSIWRGNWCFCRLVVLLIGWFVAVVFVSGWWWRGVVFRQILTVSTKLASRSSAPCLSLLGLQAPTSKSILEVESLVRTDPSDVVGEPKLNIRFRLLYLRDPQHKNASDPPAPCPRTGGF